jgi:hypothetical protein
MKGGTRKRGTTWTWHLGVLDPATGRWRQLSKAGSRPSERRRPRSTRPRLPCGLGSS